MAMETKMDPREILKRPYARLVTPDEDGSFRAEIPEFPGCLAVGNSRVEALEILEEVAVSWLESALANGQSIPEPVENAEFSGKLVLRMPRSLHRKATYTADRENVSLNALIVTAVATYLGGPQTRPAASAPSLTINAVAFNSFGANAAFLVAGTNTDLLPIGAGTAVDTGGTVSANLRRA